MRIVALTGHVLARSPLVQCAAAVADELHHNTGSAVRVAMPCYRSVLYVVRFGGGETAPWPHACDVHPAEQTAAGRVLLALRPHWRDGVLDGLGDTADLHGELATIRRNRLALDDGRSRGDEGALAVPIRGANQEPTAALELTTPTDPERGAALVTLVQHARTAADIIAARLPAAVPPLPTWPPRAASRRSEAQTR